MLGFHGCGTEPGRNGRTPDAGGRARLGGRRRPRSCSFRSVAKPGPATSTACSSASASACSSSTAARHYFVDGATQHGLAYDAVRAFEDELEPRAPRARHPHRGRLHPRPPRRADPRAARRARRPRGREPHDHARARGTGRLRNAVAAQRPRDRRHRPRLARAAREGGSARQGRLRARVEQLLGAPEGAERNAAGRREAPALETRAAADRPPPGARGARERGPPRDAERGPRAARRRRRRARALLGAGLPEDRAARRPRDPRGRRDRVGVPQEQPAAEGRRRRVRRDATPSARGAPTRSSAST